ncbi:MAG: cytochrome ubiquinol oxidase subunit I [Candidatus Micrarchaeota archaeon]|nr:cytochrome ubiquinol oxidase subunit I [Candidatus Micrarchaeota archaeon]
MVPVVMFDRFLMGFSLFVHIILASLGIALPVIMLSAEYLGVRRNDRHYSTLARRLAIAFVVLFAIGTASGILVAVEMLVLWPKFMQLVSQVAILPFYIEVFAFFVETIFIGIYFYSWDKFKNKYLHILSGVPIAVAAVLSGVLITILNAFMNTPGSVFNEPAFIANGTVTGVHPFAVFYTPSAGMEVLHAISSTYFAGAFVFLAFMAFMLLRTTDISKRTYFKKGLTLALILCVLATLLSIYSGINSIATLQHVQPEKYAAIEGNLFHNMSHAPEKIGGFPINGTLKYYVNMTDMQSILAGGSPAAIVPGLLNYSRSTWPPLIVHPMFDFMFGMSLVVGFILFVTVILWLLKRDPLESRKILWLLVICGILAVLIMEDGWILSELGRQPWIIYNVMTVASVANYSSGALPATILIFAFYAIALPLVVILLRKIFRDRPLEAELRG